MSLGWTTLATVSCESCLVHSGRRPVERKCNVSCECSESRFHSSWGVNGKYHHNGTMGMFLLPVSHSLFLSPLQHSGDINTVYIERETICRGSNTSNKRLSAHSKKLQTLYSWESMPLFVTVPSYLSHVSQAFWGIFFFLPFLVSILTRLFLPPLPHFY